jgi:hypothetical protein
LRDDSRDRTLREEGDEDGRDDAAAASDSAMDDDDGCEAAMGSASP